MMSFRRELNEYDLLKVFATFLVVIGHVTIRYNATSYPTIDTSIPQTITKLIYLFHMPLFMALSGAIYKIGENKYNQFSTFLVNKVLRLIVPYFFVGCFFLVPSIWLFQDWNSEEVLKQYENLFLGRDCRHLWYLLALFEIFVAHYFFTKRCKIGYVILLFGSIIVSTIYSYCLDFDLFSVNMAVRYYPYFIVGAILCKKKYSPQVLMQYVLSAGLIAVILKLNHYVFIDILLSTIWPIPIIAFFIVTAIFIIKKHKFKGFGLRAILEYCFPIYLFHVPIIYVFDKVVPFVNLPVTILLTIIISVIISIIIAIIIRLLHGKYLIGEK